MSEAGAKATPGIASTAFQKGDTSKRSVREAQSPNTTKKNQKKDLFDGTFALLGLIALRDFPVDCFVWRPDPTRRWNCLASVPGGKKRRHTKKEEPERFN